MFENLVVSQCAPTMAGLKTGNLFTCPFAGKDILHKNLRRLNEALVPRGARILPLRYGESRVLLYMYRPGQLKKDLSDVQATRKQWPTLSRRGFGKKAATLRSWRQARLTRP